jgi:16S rRNA (cytidine1402-2'-O)-methyltransferase
VTASGDGQGVDPIGVLVVVSTPIGNLSDLSPRAAATLESADVVCCEDTRRTGRLLSGLGLHAARLLSLHAHNERERSEEILGLLRQGATVALVSDAGTPLVSDPGERLVAAAIEADFLVRAVPGPSAVLAGLVVSGFDLAHWRFEGFLPRKGAERRDRLSRVATSSEPSVIYEAPTRVASTVAELALACGAERSVVVGRELTKLYEEVWRGRLGDAETAASVRIGRGEYVLVVDAAPVLPPTATLDVARSLHALADNGLGRRDAVAAVEVLLGVPHRTAYTAALEVAFGEKAVAVAPPAGGDEGL